MRLAEFTSHFCFAEIARADALRKAFMDTMLVNGKAYPFKNVDPKPYRLRILNACNDRYLNLQLYTSGAGTNGAAAGREAGAPVVGGQHCSRVTGSAWGATSRTRPVALTPPPSFAGLAEAQSRVWTFEIARCLAEVRLAHHHWHDVRRRRHHR